MAISGIGCRIESGKQEKMSEYIRKIRAKLGREKFIHPAARIIIENDAQQVLVIERKDNGRIGIPAGALEEGETIEEGIIREVLEETGLNLTAVEVIGISSNPELETVTYPNGDTIQYFTVEFYSNQWEGTLAPQDAGEVKRALFLNRENLAALPENERSALESLDYYRTHGSIRLK